MKLERGGATGRRRAGRLALGLGGLFTACVWLVPGFDVAYGGEGMHVALAAIEATVCLVVGGLAWTRFLRSGRLGDLTVAVAFGLVLVVENAFLLALPTLLNYEQLRPFSVWSSMLTVVLAPLVLLAGALGARRRASHRHAALLIGTIVSLLALVSLLTLDHQQQLPLAIEPGLSPIAHHHALTGNAAVLAGQAVAALVFFAAAFVSHRRSGSDDGPLLGCLGPGFVVAGLASLNYVLFPSLYSYWVYSGDILLLAFCVLLAWGLVLELRASVQRAIEMAVLEERRRLARDLHDGVAQELAFIAAEVADVPAGLHPSLSGIRSAAERGLYESRRAIAALTLPLDQPLSSLLAAAAEDVAARSGTALRLDLDETIDVGAAERETLLRVVQEATTNAIRHGGATRVWISLQGARGRLASLAVTDDGSGLGAEPAVTGFGLTSMRERVEATGGELVLTSTAGLGTTVEARWTGPPRRPGEAELRSRPASSPGS